MLISIVHSALLFAFAPPLTLFPSIFNFQSLDPNYNTAPSPSLQDPIWHGILNSSYSRLKPQLQIRLTLEVEEGQSSQVPAKAERPMSPSGLTLTLDPGGGFYQLGPDSFVQQQMFTLSLTLQNARKLPQVYTCTVLCSVKHL